MKLVRFGSGLAPPHLGRLIPTLAFAASVASCSLDLVAIPAPDSTSARLDVLVTGRHLEQGVAEATIIVTLAPGVGEGGVPRRTAHEFIALGDSLVALTRMADDPRRYVSRHDTGFDPEEATLAIQPVPIEGLAVPGALELPLTVNWEPVPVRIRHGDPLVLRSANDPSLVEPIRWSLQVVGAPSGDRVSLEGEGAWPEVLVVDSALLPPTASSLSVEVRVSANVLVESPTPSYEISARVELLVSRAVFIDAMPSHR